MCLECCERLKGQLKEGRGVLVTGTLSPEGVVWCGEVWCGVVRCGEVWCGEIWRGGMKCGVVWRRVV